MATRESNEYRMDGQKALQAESSVSDLSLGPQKCLLSIFSLRRNSLRSMSYGILQVCTHPSAGPGTLQPRICSRVVSVSSMCKGRTGAHTVSFSEARSRRHQKSTLTPLAPRLSWPATNTASQASDTYGRQRWGEAEMTGTDTASPTPAISRATTQIQL